MKNDVYTKRLSKVQVGLLTLPFISGAIRSASIMSFPPLGDQKHVWQFATVVFAIIAAYVPNLLVPPPKARIFILASIPILLVALASHAWLMQTYVVGVSLPNDHWHFVVRGTERQPFLQEPERSYTDFNLVKHLGFTDADLERGYTKSSLNKTHFQLFFAYACIVATLEFIAGAYVKSEET